jgi:hypothetical protein
LRAEHIGFDPAYVSAAIVTIGLLGSYWRWVLQGVRQGFVMGAVLAGLYGYLYLLLRLEDFALLAGSIGLFLMLAAVMFLTRHARGRDVPDTPRELVRAAPRAHRTGLAVGRRRATTILGRWIACSRQRRAPSAITSGSAGSADS